MERQDNKIDEFAFGKIPPQAIDLEEAILGALILESEAITRVNLSEQVFYKQEHQVIFRAINQINEAGNNVDMLTVTRKLNDQNQLDEIGGAVYVTKLTRQVASAAHLEYHVRILTQHFIRRELINISSQIINLSYDTSIDLDEIIEIYDRSVSKIDNVLIGKSRGRELFSVLKDLRQEIIRRYELSKVGELTGITTGFKPLDRITSGWQPGWMIIFASRPGLGKTALAVNKFAKEAAKAGKWVNIFSLEMDDLSLAERLIIGASGIDSYDFKNGNLTGDDWNRYTEAEEELQDLPIFIDDAPFVKISHIRNVARNNKKRGKCDLIIIDYLQLADSGDRKPTREQEVSDMSRRLKALAKELNVPVIVLSQLSRNVENRASRRPVLSDLRESGAIEQDADLVIFPFRPGYYEKLEGDEITTHEGVLIVAKYRHGMTGDIEFYHNGSMTKFSDNAFEFLEQERF